MGMSRGRIWFLAITAAQGGFLFGFDTIFGFFGVAMVFHLLWAIFIVPETKGKSLDELAASH